MPSSRAPGGAQEQERQQVDRLRPPPDDEQCSGAADQPQEGGGAGHQIHHRLGLDERALPVVEETDVAVQVSPETRRHRAAEHPDHRLRLQIGGGLAVHVFGPFLRLRDLRTRLHHHPPHHHHIGEDGEEHAQRDPPVDGEQIDQHHDRGDHRGDGVHHRVGHQIVQGQSVVLNLRLDGARVSGGEPAQRHS